MHLLKRLELNGFKSFAQKTVFEFPGGITAIVGPNGSGKSNVIDGIRWLLGEREAKNLRGAKAEDLIFAGTSKRARASMAQASLHFENKNKFFPVDAEEITITRQVSRDGTNTYFLNKSEIRLKDLIDFFAKARLGTKGLIVVTQGNSDLFIRVSPQERREMIEEMLGLREFQLKKTEAERRLKNTQINLDKVKALTEEILPHLRSLKRQTGRWEKRDALVEELRTLENRFFGAEHATLVESLRRLDEEIIARHAHAKTFEKERRDAETHMQSVEAQQPEGQRELEAIRAETQSLFEERSVLQKEIGRLEARIEMAAATPGSKEFPPQHELVKLLRSVREKLKGLTVDTFEKGIKELAADIDRALGESKKIVSAPDAGLTKEFAEIGEKLKALEAQISGLKNKEGALQKHQEQFYSAFKAAVAAVEGAKDRMESWAATTQKLVFEKQQIEYRQSEWERQVRQAGREPHEFAHATASAEGESRDSLERTIFKLRGDLASIGDVDEALLKEAKETETRYEFLSKESGDLEKAREDLKALIVELHDKIKTEFSGALLKINTEFEKFFGLMFGGGTARLKLQSPKRDAPTISEDDMPEVPKEKDVREEIEEELPAEGIEIDLKLPRKKLTSLSMLSGGERSLVGIAALFALISVSPPPFLVLDEVDAPLDENNARRFSDMLKEFSKKTQFILVTHNRATMESADVLYGVTLGEDEASKVVSLKFEK